MALDVKGPYRYPAPNAQWLASYQEEVLEPDLPIVDAHHHLWEEPGNRYLADDLISDLDTGHRILGTVFVQCHWGYRETGPESLRPVGETERAACERSDSIARLGDARPCLGIVGFADLTLGDCVAEVLDAHQVVAPNNVCGIRQSVARDSNFPDGIVLKPAPKGMLADSRFRHGLREVARRGLSFDAMIYHEQLPELAELARDVEEATIILDHLGCPLGVGLYRDRRAETFAAWRAGIAMLARFPNVRVKIGGLGMIITGAEYHLQPSPPSSTTLAAAWRPYFEACVEAFGVERCLFESNFPVDKAMFSYRVVWNTFKRLASGASPTEKAALFSQNALQAYGLKLA